MVEMLPSHRNQFGVKDSIDCYRTVKGVRYIQWTSDWNADLLKAYRAAGVRCRVFVEEIFIDPADMESAITVDEASK